MFRFSYSALFTSGTRGGPQEYALKIVITPHFPFRNLDDAHAPKPTRPPGPLGKPNQGGYSLPDTLKWDTAAYKEVQVSC